MSSFLCREFFYCSNIRELSAEGLHCLTANAPQYMAKEGRLHNLWYWFVSQFLRGRRELSTLSGEYADYFFLWSLIPSLPEEYFENVDFETPSQDRNAP